MHHPSISTTRSDAAGERTCALFNRIVEHMQRISGGTLSESEAIEAARNWLGLCQKLCESEAQIDTLKLKS